MGGSVKKQYMLMGKRPVLYYSVRAFQDSEYIDEIILVTSAEDIESVSSCYKTEEFPKVSSVVCGGKQRYNSVYEGLLAIEPADEHFVFIHDGARPFVDGAIIERCAMTVYKEKACVAAMPSKDTIKLADDNAYVTQTPDRRSVWMMQTPQCFEYNLIHGAYAELIQAERDGELGNLHITDDAQVCEYFASKRIKLVEGSYKNIKITTPEDMLIGEAYLRE